MAKQTRRRGPNWVLIVIVLGIALAFFAFGLVPEARRAVERYRARSGMAGADWDPLFGTQIVEGPTLEILDDWSGRITTRYEGESPIDPEDLIFYCQFLRVPATWTLDTCAIDPENPNSYVIVIVR